MFLFLVSDSVFSSNFFRRSPICVFFAPFGSIGAFLALDDFGGTSGFFRTRGFTSVLFGLLVSKLVLSITVCTFLGEVVIELSPWFRISFSLLLTFLLLPIFLYFLLLGLFPLIFSLVLLFLFTLPSSSLSLELLLSLCLLSPFEIVLSSSSSCLLVCLFLLMLLLIMISRSAPFISSNDNFIFLTSITISS